MNTRILTPAQIELDETVDYYNTESPGLGNEFLIDIMKTIDRIRLFPDAWRPFTENTRRCQLRRFPYGLVYHASETEIVIIAVAHLHRKPNYWKDRIKTLT
jgi:toxin ParE2